MDVSSLLHERRAKDDFFASGAHSPLDRAAQESFTGLSYYPPNPELVFTVPIEESDGAEVRINTSDGQVRVYRRAAVVQFVLGDETVALTLYSTGQPGYFVPFRDSTSGKTTYGAGRYLDIEPSDDGTVTIDFNLAYNPFCAYSDEYSCPLPPTENWLQVPVEAGELDYEKQRRSRAERGV